MKRHPFDPISLVLGLGIAGLGLVFVVGDRSAADIGWEWLWPIAVVVIGALFVASAARRLIPRREPPVKPEGLVED